jgi:ASTRA-associated protein 1
MPNAPAVPVFILRGHTAPVHSLLFFNANAYLASGDSEGWLVIWSLASKRPIAVWKAHAGGVSGTKIWGSRNLITHGRDHKLRVWQLALDNATLLSKTLPVEGADENQPQPWLMHSMDMSALNFCSFAVCNEVDTGKDYEEGETSVLVASPNGLDNGGIDIFQLPTGRRVSQIASDKKVNTGMVMSVALYAQAASKSLFVVGGYEDGQVGIHHHHGSIGSESAEWKRIRLIKLHSQPVLSLSIAPSQKFLVTSSADAQISKIVLDLDNPVASDQKPKLINTKHAGQQGLSIRSDSKIFATAGWDSWVRVYSARTMKELAVLSWHKEGCYSTAFADLSADIEDTSPSNEKDRQLTASALDLIKQQRSIKAQKTHWLAAGAKDGKISLWDIY